MGFETPNLVRGITLAFALSPLLVACSQPGATMSTKTGGTTGSGGSGGLGGATSSGGVSGSGGATASGGSPGSGGATASGGTAGSGGARATGGTTSGGGRTSSGGATSSGGMTGAGGTMAGGTTGGGGTQSSGGATGGRDGGSDAPAGTGGVVGSGGNTAATGGSTGAGGSTVCAPPTVNLTGTDAVAGTMITFNDDGGWCWYQDERAVVDVQGNKLVIGSMAFGGGAQVEVTIYDLATKKGTTAQLGKMSYADDHDSPALVVRPDGGYAAMWAGHNNDCYSYYSVYSGSSWAAAKKFDWTSAGCPTSSGKTVTYANMWYLGTDLVSFVRSVDTSPNYLISKDNGSSWSFGGRLTSTPQVGYVAGYYKYWGNNTDRIDFFATESHPRDNDNSLFHGYVKGGKIYNSSGTEIDTTLADTSAKNITAYTQVFKTGSTVGGVKLEHAWNADLVRYDDGNIAAIWTARVTGTGSDDPDKRLMYARYDGSAWKLTYLVKAGTKLYADEQDYTGLGALHPDDPNTIYISTPYDPSTDTLLPSGKREIWRGTTCDNGATFKWTPVTANSTKAKTTIAPSFPSGTPSTPRSSGCGGSTGRRKT